MKIIPSETIHKYTYAIQFLLYDLFSNNKPVTTQPTIPEILAVMKVSPV